MEAGGSRRERVRDLGLTQPSALLLGAQLLAIVLYPYLQDSRVGSAVLGVLSMMAVGLAIGVVRDTPALSVVAVLVGLPAAVLTIAEAVWPTSAPVVVVSGVLHAAFYAYVTYSLLRYLFHDEKVTTDELYAIAATFTVVGWTFAHVYVVVTVLSPGSIDPVSPLGAPRFFDLLFFSFTNLTSVGLSDILPTSDVARSVVILQQIAGVLYVAMVISRLVALTVARR